MTPATGAGLSGLSLSWAWAVNTVRCGMHASVYPSVHSLCLCEDEVSGQGNIRERYPWR